MLIRTRLQQLTAAKPAKPKSKLSKAVGDLNKTQRSKLKNILNQAKPEPVDPRQQRHEAAKADLVEKLLKTLKINGFNKITQREPHYRIEFDMKKYGHLTGEDVRELDAAMRNLDLEHSGGRTLSWYTRNLGILVSISGETGKSYYATIQYFK